MPTSKKLFIWGVLIILSLATTWRLFRPGYFSMQDDIQVFRLQQLDSCLSDLQIPCRFIQDGGLGYGYPLYNFYSPLPYYLAYFLHHLGFSYIVSLKIVFIIPTFLRTFFMFWLGKTLFDVPTAFLISVLFSFAPYLAVDQYVRGALGEFWALSLFPAVIFYLVRNNQVGLIISLSAVFLSHNLTSLYVMVFSLAYSLLQGKLVWFVRRLVYALSLSAFFLVPAIFEKKYVMVETMTQGYFNYINHFVTLKELFLSRFWGYGASLWGPIDDMSLQIGVYHWLIPLATIPILFISKKSKPSSRLLYVFLWFSSLIALFLTHNKSTFIWKFIPILAYYQFPWRFLGLATFTLSLLSGFSIYKIQSSKLKNILVVFLIACIALANVNYFKEDIWFWSINDQDKLTTAEIYRQSGAGLKDYWPSFSQEFPTQMASLNPEIKAGQVDQIFFSKTSSRLEYSFVVTSDSAFIALPLVYFPGWQLQIDNQKVHINIDEKYGQIMINAPTGQHLAIATFTNTPIRSFSNFISLTSFFYFLYYYYRYAKK